MKSNKKVTHSQSENPLPDQEKISSKEIQPRKFTFNWLKILLPALALIIVISLAIAIYYFPSSSKPTTEPVAKPVAKPSVYPTPTPALKPVVSEISGSVKKIPTDLQLVTYNNKNYPITYYEAGTFTSGKYAGYKRIIATFADNLGEGTTNCDNTTFLTKDDKQYIGMPIYIGTSAYTKQVTEIKTFDNSLPNSFSLNDNDKLTTQSPTLVISMNNDNFNCTLITDTSNYAQFALPGKNYQLYTTNSLDKPLIETIGDYFVKDQAGVVFTYNLDKQIIIDERTYTYLKPFFRSENVFGSLAYYIGNDVRAPLYSEKIFDDPQGRSFLLYDVGLDSGFTNPAYTPDFSNVKADDFTQIFLIENKVPLYVLKDSPNTTAIYQTRYKKLQLTYAKNPDQIPTYEDYIKNHPFVFLKDPFGRFILHEEALYLAPSNGVHRGGAKPVIYLYPTQKTNVHIFFDKQMYLTVQIPTYHNGWDVSANPSGIITDLQPQFTNCNVINTQAFGSEYAKDACKNNQYPYIYWAGYIHNESFPFLSDGWTVSKNDLRDFLNQKLTQIGLNTKERQDMLSYWIPTMGKQNVNYFHIAFLLTNDMDKLVPTTVTPKPDTTIRVFLDWSPLNTKPAIEPQPQNLPTTKRTGFTYVEWGGLMAQD